MSPKPSAPQAGRKPKPADDKRGRPKTGNAKKGGAHGNHKMIAMWSQAPSDAHEWVCFEDPDEQRTWRFDVTFLMSHWECIFGRGCQGVLTAPAPELVQGCCSYGAHFTGPEDVDRVKAAAKALRADQWQYAGRASRGVTRRQPGGAVVSRLVDGACIFLNRPGFPGGPGCALHRAALENGQLPMDLKPDVCWQLPLRREDVTNADGSVTSTVGQWDREHWGQGGEEFAWWCTEAPEAFGGAKAVWRQMQPELNALVGVKVGAMVAAYLEVRERDGHVLPHPTVRPRA